MGNVYHGSVKSEWLDYNGHMNLAYYVLAFDLATDEYYKRLGVAENYNEIEKCSMFTTEINVAYIKEMLNGQLFYVETYLNDYNAKLMHYLHQMRLTSTDELVATNECLAIHVDMKTRRSSPFPASIQTVLQSDIDQQTVSSELKDTNLRLAIRKPLQDDRC